MMKLYCKTLVVFIISAIFVGGVLPAHGKKDVEEKYSSTLESWQETFDINNKKKGKYNIFVTANDFGGNRTVVGPYNMYVDPESDKPICGITNPTQDMRVVGNLNIVGTCFDDDAVQYVELVFDGDDENPVRAKGQEFWSYYLDTHDLEEGPHSIKVTGYDINGLASNPLVLSWNLDRRQPVTLVTSNMMGDLVSGTVKFSGNVSDGNGVKYLYYSIDGGQTFFDVKLKNNKDGTKDFIISVDSRKFSDGPQVLWFKAVDLAGSEGIYSFLYFVDNTKPEVSILYPAAESEMNGKFLIAGMAKDILGLKSLKWTFGSESGDYELIPGNPYWGVLCDTTGSTDKSRKFEVMVQDLAGNIITVNQLINLNQDGDKPVVEITEPAANSSVSAEDSVFVRGIAHDDDGVSLIRYKLDNGEWVEQKTKGTFYAELCRGSDLSAGSHTVSIVAVDKNGEGRMEVGGGKEGVDRC